MKLKVLMFLMLATGFVRGEEVSFPVGLEVGASLYVLPQETMPLDKANWWASEGTEATLTEGGLSIKSGEANPLLQLQKKLEGNLLVRIRVSFDPKQNHYFRFSLFNRIAVEYNSQFKRFALMEKSDPSDPTANDYAILDELRGDLSSFATDTADFTLYIAVADSGVAVWCDDARLFSHSADGIIFQGGLAIQSGWKSDWTIKSLEIYELNGGL